MAETGAAQRCRGKRGLFRFIYLLSAEERAQSMLEAVARGNVAHGCPSRSVVADTVEGSRFFRCQSCLPSSLLSRCSS